MKDLGAVRVVAQVKQSGRRHRYSIQIGQTSDRDGECRRFTTFAPDAIDSMATTFATLLTDALGACAVHSKAHPEPEPQTERRPRFDRPGQGLARFSAPKNGPTTPRDKSNKRARDAETRQRMKGK